MATNKDGLEPGQIVDFYEIVRVESERKKNAKRSKPSRRKSAEDGEAGQPRVSGALRTETAQEEKGE